MKGLEMITTESLNQMEKVVWPAVVKKQVAGRAKDKGDLSAISSEDEDEDIPKAPTFARFVLEATMLLLGENMSLSRAKAVVMQRGFKTRLIEYCTSGVGFLLPHIQRYISDVRFTTKEVNSIKPLMAIRNWAFAIYNQIQLNEKITQLQIKEQLQSA